MTLQGTESIVSASEANSIVAAVTTELTKTPSSQPLEPTTKRLILHHAIDQVWLDELRDQHPHESPLSAEEVDKLILDGLKFEVPIGFVEVPASSTLTAVREAIDEELDEPPTAYSFLTPELAPVGAKQEQKTSVSDYGSILFLKQLTGHQKAVALKRKKGKAGSGEGAKEGKDKDSGSDVDLTNLPFDIKEKKIYSKEGEVKCVQQLMEFSQKKDQALCTLLRQLTNRPIFYDEKPVIPMDAMMYYMQTFRTHKTNKTLQPLLKFLEKEFAETTKKVESMISEGNITYGFLWYIFQNGSKILGYEGEHKFGMKIGATSYNCGFFGGSFEIKGTVIKTNGAKFATASHTISICEFDGMKTLDSLRVRPLGEEEEEILKERGRLFNRVGCGQHYMQYRDSMLWKQWWCVNHIKATGRVMVDGISFRKMNPNYRLVNVDNSEKSMVTVPDDYLFSTWPFVYGFSFAAKKWGEVVVDQLSDIVFVDDAFDRLVLDEEKKKLVHSLVTNSDKTFGDIISGKGGGCIFLLHGAPGTGKTLTAEAIAELLHRPLYSVSVGELGVTTQELENKLRDILEVASAWNAVILIDEADIFLERRTENDIKRNALVGIFLRLLEYHQGVLFLTTNRVKCFDEAFHSRISVALRYAPLNEDARAQVWENLVGAAGITGLNSKELAKFDINGRQIKTTIRLAQALAYDEKTQVSAEHIARTIHVAKQFVTDLAEVEE